MKVYSVIRIVRLDLSQTYFWKGVSKMVLGDIVLQKMKEAKGEMVEKESVFELDESGMYLSSVDLVSYQTIKAHLANLIGLLEYDEIRGSNAVSTFISEVIDTDIGDVFYRLVEHRNTFPKVWELYDYIESKKGEL